MKLKTKGIAYLLFSVCCVALSSSAIASHPKPSHPKPKHHYTHHYKRHYYNYKDDYKGERHYYRKLGPQNHFEVIGAFGIAKLKAGNSQLGVTSDETDTLVQTNENTWNTLAGQLGIGYIYYFSHALDCPDQVQGFPSIEPQLNIYQLSTNSIHGDVWRFGSPAFNQFKYDMPIHSTRLMLDVALNIVTWQQLSLYAKAGIGNAWTRVNYSDNSNVDCPEQSLRLKSNTSSTFVWEAGAGVTYAFNDRVGVSFEYLYTDLGNVQAGSTGSFGNITAPAISAPSFDLKSQTALLGLHIAV